MANSDASSATVRVLVSFYHVATVDTSSSSASASAIHPEKFNVPLSSDVYNGLFNFVKRLKIFTGLAEIAKSKGLGGNPVCYIVLFHHNEVQNVFLFCKNP